MSVKVVGVAVAVVLVLFVVAALLGTREGGRVEPDPDGILGDVRSLLAGDADLEAEDVSAACFDGARFQVGGGAFPCLVDVPEDVRTVTLDVLAGDGVRTVLVQEDALDQEEGPFATGDRVELELFGEGGVLTLSCPTGCVLGLP